MDKLGSKKRLYAGLGEYARGRRAEEMRKKYGTGNAELDRAAALQDEAVDEAELPTEASIAVKTSPLVKGAQEANAEMDADLLALDEDEEMKKWTRKQMGG